MNESGKAPNSSGEIAGQKNKWDSLDDGTMSFQVAPGINKEEEFKRLTGEDWPGKTYFAESYGADDDGYDTPIETWVIRKRATVEESDVLDGTSFQVAPGINKEEEFKRLTGEDWPGKTYFAESYGADDDGYDTPIETWVIHKRPTTDSAQTVIPEGQERGETATEKPEQAEQSEVAKIFSIIKGMRPDLRDEDIREVIKKMSKEDRERFIGDKPVATEQPDIDEKTRLEEEEKAKLELEEKAKLVILIKEMTGLEDDAVLELIEKMTEEERQKFLHGHNASPKPLYVVNVDFTHDRDELAHDLAERKLNQEVSSSRGLKGWLVGRLWKGTLFRSYYEAKYTRELKEGTAKTEVDGGSLSVEELIARRKAGAIERFILSKSEEYSEEERSRFIHSQAGEEIVEVDDIETTATIRDVIKKFAHDWAERVKDGGADFEAIKTSDDIKREFQNEIRRKLAEFQDKGKKTDRVMFDNYFEVAVQAAEAATHFSSIDEVMEGFRVYNAEARDSVRTEAHRDAIDRITNAIEKTKIGQFIPAEVLAAAGGIAVALTKTSARTIARSLGVGFVASSVISGLKERNRITEDRTRMLRDAAEGVTYEGQSSPDSTKTSRYEARIWGTRYDIKKASDLTADIKDALKIEEGEARREALIRAIAEAKVRVGFSDSEKKDLIAYTSADQRGEERLKLDMATILAERALSDEDRKILKDKEDEILERISGDVEQSDSKFQRERAILSAKRAGKSLLFGATTFFVSQEIIAFVDPNKIGLLEKTGIIKPEALPEKLRNNANAEETLLAQLLGTKTSPAGGDIVSNISGDNTDRIRELEAQGYQKVEVEPASTAMVEGEIPSRVVNVSDATGVKVTYDGWANNGTTYSDGNELRLYIENGSVVSGMSGVSTMGSETFDYADLVGQGKIKGYLTLGDTKFEIQPHFDASGRLSWGENGVFTTVNGETIEAALSGDNLVGKYFEIAVDRGVDANGIQHIVPLATEIGSNSFAGGIRIPSEVAETIINTPAVYDFFKPQADTVSSGVTGFGIFGFSPRTGLGATRNPETPSSPAPAASPTDGTTESKPVSSGDSVAPSGQPSKEPEAAQPIKASATESTANPVSESASNSATSNSESLSASEQLLASTRERAKGENLPQQAIDFITEPNSTGPNVYTSEKASEYQTWWNGQNDETRNKVIAIIKSVENHPNFISTRWGNSFRTWLRQNHKEAFSN